MIKLATRVLEYIYVHLVLNSLYEKWWNRKLEKLPWVHDSNDPLSEST